MPASSAPLLRYLRTCLGEAMGLAREANGYLDHKAPWFQIKEDRRVAATSVYVILRVVDNLKTLLAPVLPHTAQRLHEYLGYDGQLRCLSTGHAAGGRVRGGDAEPRGADVRSQRGGRHLDQERAAGPKGGLWLRGRRCGSRGRCSRSWMRVWWRRSTRGWRGRRERGNGESRNQGAGAQVLAPAFSRPADLICAKRYSVLN